MMVVLTDELVFSHGRVDDAGLAFGTSRIECGSGSFAGTNSLEALNPAWEKKGHIP